MLCARALDPVVGSRREGTVDKDVLVNIKCRYRSAVLGPVSAPAPHTAKEL